MINVLHPTSPNQFAEHTKQIIKIILCAIITDAHIDTLRKNNFVAEAKKLASKSELEWTHAEKLIVAARKLSPPSDVC